MRLPRHSAVHALSLAFAVAIAFALIEPVPPNLENATHEIAFPVDKLVHFALFLVAAVPWRRSLAVLGVKSPGLAVVVTGVVYGGLLEIAQGLFTARDAEFLDMVAGALGAAAAVGVIERARGWKVEWGHARRPARCRVTLPLAVISPRMRVKRTFEEQTRVNHADSPVLIVDDDAQLGRLVATVAESCGFKARVAVSAREAWLALDPVPALVLLDLNMPDADGLEVLRELASRRCSAQIRVFSGTDPRILRSAVQLGRGLGLRMGEPLSKPVSVAQLRDIFGELARVVAAVMPEPAAVSTGAPAPPEFTVDELRHGIRNGELFVAFQPILDLETLSPLGAEALVRWRHPRYGVVPPACFVPFAESSGLAVEMTERIFALALEFAGQPDYVWEGRPLAISVNVSAAALIEFDLAALLAALLPAYGVAPGRLVVEVTETVMSADRTRVLEVLSRLRLRDIELSIDDFGTGTSSLERLDQFPFTELKIERAFIADLLQRPEAEAIARSTIDLARQLDLRVVGEGIEDVRTLRWLRSAGCETGQGFLFARGLEENEFSRWLAEWGERRPFLLDASSP